MTAEEYTRRLKEQGLTEEGLREDAKKDLAIKKLQEKYSSKIAISDREVEDYYTNNRQQFVNARGVGLAMIVADPADNSQQGFTNDAKGENEAKAKIDDIYQQLKTGADFATVARAKSEDQSLLQGGDVGFATEDQLKQNGFPQDLISQLFGPMQPGSFTAPVHFASPGAPGGRWYIFKLTDKRLQTENLTLESPNVRPQITETLTNQRKDILNAALLEVAMSEAKIVNNLAAEFLTSPSNLGMRPATGAAKPESSSSPAASTATSPAKSESPAAKPSASLAKPATSPAKPAVSPAKSGSPAK
jgi:peptidyl-prolyl cis-trans isomerase SurA